jgi:ATP-binding cassette subfamily B protein/subfamily B ATP-binding cassette protein MsbA
MSNFRRVMAYFAADWPLTAAGVGCVLLGIIANLLKPWPVKVIIDDALIKRPADAPGVIGLMAATLLGLHLLETLFNAAQTYIMIVVGQRGAARVRFDLFRRLQRLPMRFHHRQQLGDTIYRVTGDTFAFQNYFQHGLVTASVAAVTLVAMLIIMAKLNLRLTLVAALVVPVLLAVFRGFSSRLTERATLTRQAESDMTSRVHQVMSAIPVVRAYIREEHEEAQFASSSERALVVRLAQHRIEIVYWLVIGVVLGAATAAMTWLGALDVLAGRLTLGQLTVFLAYLAMLFAPLQTLSNVVSTMQGALAGVRRVFEVLDQPEEIRDAPGAVAVGIGGKCRGEVEFREVGFSYETGRDILRGVNLRIQPGQRVAVIGPSGVGKTTMLQLLPRFYDPTSGEVLLDGRDARTITGRSLRAQISVVLQDAILMPATVAENIAYGKPGASREEVIAAAKAANADAFIAKLPRGYDTPIGEGGHKLSGGERQRIAIARAFLKDAPVLVMDEPTSALDAESEAAIVDALQRLMKNRAVLMVAHRLSTVRDSDQIAVLQQGAITELGSHAELMKRGGYYARLMERQLKR